jgi:two-component system, NtrC family, response regulator PilR
MSATALPTNQKFSCLLVDDDPGFVDMLSKVVSDEGGRPTGCYSIAEARARITQQSYDLVVLDNRLPDGTGYDFYSHLIRHCPASVVAMVTGAPELSQAVELTRNGLFDYLTKPVGTAEFAGLLRRARMRLGRPEIQTEAEVLLGEAPVMRELKVQLRQAAQHKNAPVLLLGETGTGKDLAARLLHQMTFGDRARTTPYVALNCPNVPSEMFEAELFGSEKGAYTGADRRRTGLVEAAEGGTLFLDEVVEIPLSLQPKLLRFLESREYRSLGATETCHFAGRVVAATNRSLPEQVRAGRFREDLMYRLDVFSIHLPPLREHLADVDAIAEYLLSQLCERYQRARPLLKTADLDALRGHTFPGNVRELRNLLERSLLRTDPGSTHLVMDLAWLKGHSAAAQVPSEPNLLPTPPADRQLSPIELQEYQMIGRVLKEENGGIRRAAARLGLTHQALLRRLQKWPELRRVAAPAE